MYVSDAYFMRKYSRKTTKPSRIPNKPLDNIPPALQNRCSYGRIKQISVCRIVIESGIGAIAPLAPSLRGLAKTGRKTGFWLGECTFLRTTLPPSALMRSHLPQRGRQGSIDNCSINDNLNSRRPVGVDAHIDPKQNRTSMGRFCSNTPVMRNVFVHRGQKCFRADVGIRPYDLIDKWQFDTAVTIPSGAGRQ